MRGRPEDFQLYVARKALLGKDNKRESSSVLKISSIRSFCKHTHTSDTRHAALAYHDTHLAHDALSVLSYMLRMPSWVRNEV